MNACSLLVTVKNRQVVRVSGDPDSPLFRNYSCIKGRVQPQLLSHPQRLLAPMKRLDDGGFAPISLDQAVDEIAAKLRGVIDRHGASSVASYWGMMSSASPSTKVFLDAFFDAIGGGPRFTPITIDKPGKRTAKSLHGWWMAPWQGFDEPDVILILGMNPLVSHQGFPIGNPGAWLKAARARGMDLVVVDPRRTETARKASLFLQPRPGCDVAILAGLIHIILAEGLYDRTFTDAHVSGVEALGAAVAPFTPQAVAAHADLDSDDLIRAARLFGGNRRGYCIAGTGPHMAGDGTLIEYLVLSLDALCGHYLREGERVRNPGTVAATFSAKAQAHPPEPALTGRALAGSGLPISVAGPPVAGACESMLSAAPGGVRALFSVGGNPAAAWPDQIKTIEGLRSLDLLVQVDPWMSATSKLAHYIIAPRMALETAAFTAGLESQAAYAPGYGCADSYAQYAPAAAEPPHGSETVEEWMFFYRLAQRMGLSLRVVMQVWGTQLAAMDVDMATPPDSEALLELLASGARIPLAAVKDHAHGAFFPDPPVHVAPADPGWTGRLQVGDPGMLAELAASAGAMGAQPAAGLRLLCRRMRHVYNSSGNVPAAHRGRAYNPAFMHPADLAALGLADGELVELTTERATIRAVVEADPDLRRSVVSIAHAYGDLPHDEDPLAVGANTNRLLDVSGPLEPITGQAPMSNIPVRVRPFIA